MRRIIGIGREGLAAWVITFSLMHRGGFKNKEESIERIGNNDDRYPADSILHLVSCNGEACSP